MRIGYDGKRAVQNFTGLGNYSRYVIDLLLSHYPDNEYLSYSPGAPVPGSTGRYPSGSLWRSFGITRQLRKDKIDLFHGLSNELPFTLNKSRIPGIVTIHDLIFMRYPEYYPFTDRMIYRAKTSYAARHSHKVVAISQQTKRDIQHYFDIPESHIEVIYQNCALVFRKKCEDAALRRVKDKYKLPGSYVLSVGTVEPRKNLMLLVNALQELPGVPLVVVGRTDSAYAKQVFTTVRHLNLANRILFLTNVAHNDLPCIYQSAEVFVYPSRFEGFGIPIIEALHSEVPVIAAKGSCLEEAGGPDSIYVSADDPLELAEAIRRVLDNTGLRNNMIARGREYLDTFADERIASQYMNLYKNVCSAN